MILSPLVVGWGFGVSVPRAFLVFAENGFCFGVMLGLWYASFSSFFISSIMGALLCCFEAIHRPPVLIVRFWCVFGAYVFHRGVLGCFLIFGILIHWGFAVFFLWGWCCCLF